ncbi:S-layer family protein [Kamptonema sp. UHCC 0994]|uniref:S-layer family protein n=1 Tax=Kamptonema sp. UHCC 0994 TaxID=3031329 RepID=UPI0023B8C295|nr:S-layer family protein [Kamptonema sp. UHCC 0994]MDF0552513.1 S-layer family protein [Kamptonema sp. UHCC 0994]
MKQGGILFWSFSSIALCYLGQANPTRAQIVPDTTLPVNSTVTPAGSTLSIAGGTRGGDNLFHSFKEFSVRTGSTAYFNNPLDVQNIITRVTGGSISNIDGILKANGTANLFLLNPNGIIFGPNASLNIGGSFLASTASAVKLADGIEFSAIAPNPPSSLLRVNVPIGLQYGSNPGSIVNQSRAINSNGQIVGLQVLPSKTIAIAGGDVRLDGGNLQAPGGRVELGSLRGRGTVGINWDSNNLSLSFPNEVARGDVSLTNGAQVNVRAKGGGVISVNARNLQISQGSTLRAGIAAGVGNADIPAGDIELNATGEIAVTGTQTFISNAVLSNSKGQGGDIRITAGSLRVTNGGQIFTGIFGQGNSGNVNITVRDKASFEGEGSDNVSSGAYSLVQPEAVGQGGDINLRARTLSVTNGAVLQASTLGQGNAGSININVRDTVSFDGANPADLFSSGAYSRVEDSQTVGRGGSINITAGTLSVTNGAVITTSTGGQGNPGTVTINVRDTIILDGVGPFREDLKTGQSSGVFSSVKETGVGEGGNIRINTRVLSVGNGAVVIANTFGQGNGGNIQINADSIYLAGVDVGGQSSGIFTPTEPGAIGKAGEILLNTDSFRVTDRAVVSSRTLNSSDGGRIVINARAFEATNGGQVLTTTSRGGNAGEIAINTRDRMILEGTNNIFTEQVARFGPDLISNVSASSGLFASTEKDSTGSGGNLTVQAGQLIVQEGAQVSVSAEGSGSAGNLIVNANSIRLDNGEIAATTSAGNFGNIRLQAQDLQLRRGSNITTNARGSATGGNITINTGVLAALENSDISANSQEARGGQVFINAQGIFGTEGRSQPTLNSDITATGGTPELSGTVDIQTPDINPTSSLLVLPQTPVDVASLIDRRCSTGNPQISRFINVGRGGQPPSPSEPLNSSAGWVDERQIAGSTENPSIINGDSENSSDRLVEAQGWVINATGQVELVADAPVVTPYSFWSLTPPCNGGKKAVNQ